jgi:uncharacterized protein YecT (DUF1311 family)
MFIAPLMLLLAQETDNIPYHYVARQCAPQGDGRQAVFFGIDSEICADVQAVDRRLNTVYRTLIMSLDNGSKTQLLEEQRSWILTRNSRCDLLDDGSVGSYNEAECFMKETTARIGQLRRWKRDE